MVESREKESPDGPSWDGLLLTVSPRPQMWIIWELSRNAEPELHLSPLPPQSKSALKQDSQVFKNANAPGSIPT